MSSYALKTRGIGAPKRTGLTSGYVDPASVTGRPWPGYRREDFGHRKPSRTRSSRGSRCETVKTPAPIVAPTLRLEQLQARQSAEIGAGLKDEARRTRELIRDIEGTLGVGHELQVDLGESAGRGW